MNETPLMFAKRLLHGPGGVRFLRALDTIWDRFELIEGIAILMVVCKELGLPPAWVSFAVAKAVQSRGIRTPDALDREALGRALREITDGLRPPGPESPESS